MQNSHISSVKELNEYANLLNCNGFTILSYYNEKNKRSLNTFFKFYKGGFFGYCQKERFEGFSLSTVNKPNSEYGTGTRHKIGYNILTIENAEKCLKHSERIINKNKNVKNYNLDSFKKDSYLDLKIIDPIK